MIVIESKGSFRNTESFLKRVSGNSIYSRLDGYAQEGVYALEQVTPKDTTKTSEAWAYTIDYSDKSTIITWTNDRQNDGVPIVILLQYGHATGTGGYIQGQDFINPAMQPIFDDIADKVWKAVKSA